jgi:hypothetical protein
MGYVWAVHVLTRAALGLAWATHGRSLFRRKSILDGWYDYRGLTFVLYPLVGRFSNRGYAVETVDNHGRIVRRRFGISDHSGGVTVVDLREALDLLGNAEPSGQATEKRELSSSAK